MSSIIERLAEAAEALSEDLGAYCCLIWILFDANINCGTLRGANLPRFWPKQVSLPTDLHNCFHELDF